MDKSQTELPEEPGALWALLADVLTALEEQGEEPKLEGHDNGPVYAPGIRRTANDGRWHRMVEWTNASGQWRWSYLPPVQPVTPVESLGTIWVCGDCLHHHANGECGSCHDDEHGHDKEPLSAIEAPNTVAMGMAYEEHAEDCEVRIQGQWPDNYECDCETNTFSKSQCEGCGSYLHGERHALTLFNR